MPKLNLIKLKPFSIKGAKELVGIDFSDNSLKLVLLKNVSGKMEVSNLLIRNIAGLADDEIAKTIKQSFSELGAKAPNVINIIPSHLVITKNIEIPSVNPDEIREIISLQAGRHTPYSREEIIVDFVDIGTYKRSYTKILLVIVARSLIKRQFEILERAGLKLEKVLLSSDGIAWSTSKVLKLESFETPVGIIHIDEQFSDFTVVFKDKVIYIRSISIGAEHLMNDPSRNQVKFAEEVRSSLESYQSEDIEKAPGTVVLTGAVEELRGLPPVLTEALHQPVKIVSYFRDVLVSNEAFNKVTLAKQVSFFNVIACLLGRQEIKINLVPEEVKLRKAFEERGRELIKSGILILSIFVLVFLILVSKIYFNSLYLKKLELKYAPISTEAQKLEKDLGSISLVKNYLLKRGFSLEVLSELYNIASSEIEISDIRFDDQGKFTIRGTAESMSAVFNFVEEMAKSKYFTDVKTKYTTKRKEGLKDVADFEVGSVMVKK